MQLDGIHHVSINVSDLDAALAFYVGVLGMTQLQRPDLNVPGAWLASGDQELHLLQTDSGPPLKQQHFAFRVADVDAARHALTEAGCRASEPVEIVGVCRQTFTRDPSGNLVEFNQSLR